MISVAIATYNGEKYIKEQLISILNQSLLPSEIIICDDNSTDRTLEIVNNLMEQYPIIKIFKNDINLGVNKNFENAITLCSGEYIALSDQDDVWYPNKLQIQFSKIQEQERICRKGYLIVHDVQVVDNNLNIIDSSFLKYTGLKSINNKLEELIIWNRNIGCSMFFNRDIKNQILPFGNHILMHDHWISLVSIIHGEVFSLNSTLLVYRQHDRNVTITNKLFLVKKISSFFKFRKNYLKNEIAQANDLLQKFPNNLSDSHLRIISNFICLENKSWFLKKIFVLKTKFW
jgi:glycosyltransferase involved in cell wall biosynthesis